MRLNERELDDSRIENRNAGGFNKNKTLLHFKHNKKVTEFL